MALIALVAFGSASDAAGDTAASRHAYYLFLTDAPRGCEDCYVPLLISGQTLEKVATSGGDTTVVLITTYERDSIWKLERNVSLAAADVATKDRLVRIRDRRYRYQEIGPAEVLRLLENPSGSIPVHRIVPAPDQESLADLIAAFRGVEERPSP